MQERNQIQSARQKKELLRSIVSQNIYVTQTNLSSTSLRLQAQSERRLSLMT